MNLMMKTILVLILIALSIGLGSYINFYESATWSNAFKWMLFPVPICFIIAYVLYKFYKGLVAFKKMFSPRIDPKKNDISAYEALRDSLKTGDVVAFSSDGLGGLPIKFGTWSQYTHVGLVVSVPMSDGKERIFFIEADDKKGVVLVRLSSKLEFYKGSAYLFRLEPNEGFDTRGLKEKLYDYAMVQLGKGYDFPAIKGISEKILGFTSELNRQDDGSFICSELVGRAFQVSGLVTTAKTASYFSPKDVTEFECLKGPIKLI